MKVFAPLRYLRELALSKLVLWCYLLWYLCMAVLHFDPSPRLWLTSLGISVVIGVGLILSVTGSGAARPDPWTIARLFMMPFCVSSFSALIKDRGFVLIFSPVLSENLLALGACALLVAVRQMLRSLRFSQAIADGGSLADPIDHTISD